MERLEGKVAMVTGSGGQKGFGRAIARKLASEGADLVLTDVAPAGVRVVASKAASGWRGIEAVADEVRAAGRRAVTALVDVRAADQVRRAVDLADRTFGRIDILVTTPPPRRAPTASGRRVEEDAWRTVLETNLTGTYLQPDVAEPWWRAGLGRIIALSSGGRVGYRAWPRTARQVRRDGSPGPSP
jgi:3-oxoacyl-[acyl-carrier protein] reductase/meso-butanediol dehydrogenase/(S,S)-butanediol dehydrogenase/diacetyl reductase